MTVEATVARTRHTITVGDGTEIFFKDWGTGQPIVFSHGSPLNSDAWEDQMVFLAMHDGLISLARLAIETEGRVEGIDEQQFSQYAEDAKATCPIARALSGIPEIVLKAKLTG
jgi:hypothetical protein